MDDEFVKFEKATGNISVSSVAVAVLDFLQLVSTNEGWLRSERGEQHPHTETSDGWNWIVVLDEH